MSRAALTAAFVALALALVAFFGAGDAGAEDLPLPRGSRALDDGRHVSPLSFRETLEWSRAEMVRRGLGVEERAVERSHGVVFSRFLFSPGAPFAALHIVLADGVTTMYFVAPEIIRGSSNGRTPDSGSGYLGSNPSPRTK